MLNIIRKIFSPPVFNDEEKSRNARILNVTLWASLILLFVLRVVSVSGSVNWWQRLANPVSILIVVLAALIVLMKLGFIQQTSFFLLISAWAALSFQAYTYNGIYDVAYISTFVLVLLAGLLLDFWYSILFAVLSIMTGWSLALFQTNSGIPLEVDAPLNFARDFSVVFVLFTLVTYLIISGLRNAAKVARENEQTQTQTNRELLELHATLEQRVEERTNELEASKSLAEKNTQNLEAVAEISHSMASIQDMDELLPTIAILISERYDYYHAALYLIDDAGEYAVLGAASSEEGQRLLESQHKLRVEPSSMVGFAASRGQVRVASNVDQDITYLALQELPDTKSEAVFPLSIGTKIIGVLDVQSKHPNAFSDREVNILNTLASLAAISIQNARSFSETRQALDEAEKIYQQFVQQGWKRISKELPVLGYRYAQDSTIPLRTRDVTATAETISTNPGSEVSTPVLSIPIKLRNQTIGHLRVRSTSSDQEWNQDELTMIQATADRAALALENARLLEDSQRRATRERAIGEITAKISEKSDIDAILRSTVEELGKKLGDAAVAIQIGQK